MDATLKAAMEQPHIREFTALRVELADGYTINIIDGSGFVTMMVDGQAVTFDGSDPIYGALASASSIQEQVATDSPRFTFALKPPSASALGSLSDPKNQGSLVRCWWGVIDEMNGYPIGVPELLWAGRFDIVRTTLSENDLTAEIETISAFDRLYAASEGTRLNATWHRSIWPDESGLDFNIAALGEPYWGTEMNNRKGFAAVFDAARARGAITRF